MDSIHVNWLLRLRFAAVFGQVVTIVGVHFGMGIPLRLPPLMTLIGIALISNVVPYLLIGRKKSLAVRGVGVLMVIDVLLLSGLLYFTGGAWNPFGFLYLVLIALSAVLMPPRFTWGLVGLSILCSALLFVDYHPLPLAEIPHHRHMQIHLYGMWVAFSVAAGFLVYFLLRITAALAAHQRALQEAQVANLHKERLASLATLAAGAAHELSTPLSTIAVVTGELSQALADLIKDSKPERSGLLHSLAEDVRLIRKEVDRCRRVLSQMAADAGQGSGEDLLERPLAELIAEATSGLPANPQLVIELDPHLNALRMRLPQRAVAQALRALIKNAQDASPKETLVRLEATYVNETLRVRIHDQGKGMSTDIQARLGEPFFTTKAPGQGMGLGVFLCRAVTESLGGHLRISSIESQGTVAEMVLPNQTDAIHG